MAMYCHRGFTYLLSLKVIATLEMGLNSVRYTLFDAKLFNQLAESKYIETDAQKILASVPVLHRVISDAYMNV